ncbi:hypothetical protein CDL15_Pgr002993 [Punica granatum]|uniref:Arabinogalactan peptide 13-like n=2 Tax=Punica granatum TaxID=22663 RepID=A0A218X377_PUNGR|nr:hypothetical protein CDL15_Pgr002993 [Punica granatum]PKI34064.1 hypothetical protein CRG98_045521 [Punica granatum]
MLPQLLPRPSPSPSRLIINSTALAAAASLPRFVSSGVHSSPHQDREMEATKMRLFFAVVVALMAALAVEKVAAAEAPAPSPTSDAATFAPAAAFASLAALAFGYLF